MLLRLRRGKRHSWIFFKQFKPSQCKTLTQLVLIVQDLILRKSYTSITLQVFTVNPNKFKMFSIQSENTVKKYPTLDSLHSYCDFKIYDDKFQSLNSKHYHVNFKSENMIKVKIDLSSFRFMNKIMAMGVFSAKENINRFLSITIACKVCMKDYDKCSGLNIKN